MGTIKSAFEIAMENSKGIEADKELVENNRLRDEGKRLASKVLDDPAFDLKPALKAYDAAQGKLIREGLMQSLLANLVLPIDEFAMKDTKRLGDAISAAVSDPRKVGMIFSQLDGFFKEYVGERKRLVETIESQYASEAEARRKRSCPDRWAGR